MQGNNVRLAVYRRSATRDAIGGPVVATAALYSNVPARVSTQAVSLDSREQGFETPRLLKAIIHPARLYNGARESDEVVITGGLWDGLRYKVTAVRRDSLPATDARSHLELDLEATARGRTEV